MTDSETESNDDVIMETDIVTVLSSVHGRQRRLERDLTKRDLRLARNYGEKETVYNDRGHKGYKFTFADIVYLTDETTDREITSWPVQACGIDVQKRVITKTMEAEHDKAKRMLARDKTKWTSHTVVVVDQSGSMRKNDASEGSTRSDIVWLALALDIVAKPLSSGERSSTDVFSLVTMSKHGGTVLEFEPFDWILYNKLVDLLRTSQPIGDGNYIPALNEAEGLLMANSFGKCAPTLLFLSDGRPSDKPTKGLGRTTIGTITGFIKRRVGRLASQFGRRLTIGAIALGEPGIDNFKTLRAFVDEAKEYGSGAVFQPASLSAGVLARTLSTLTSTATSTMVEMTDVTGSHQREVRKFTIEPIKKTGGSELTDEWKFVLAENIGPLHNMRSIVRTRWVRKQGWKPYSQREMFSSNRAVGVAYKIPWFGEGAERLVKEFREVDVNGYFVGPPLVAKDTRFKREGSGKDEKAFHRVFCLTQLLAQEYAHRFNRKLQSLAAFGLVSEDTPLIEFLDCSVYMLEDSPNNRHGFLVERMLDIKKYKYEKWNTNDGRLKNAGGDDEGFVGTVCKNPHNPPVTAGGGGTSSQLMGVIEEEEEEEEEDSEDDENEEAAGKLDDDCDDGIWNDDYDREEGFEDFNPDLTFHVNDIPQAFSCFTYRRSRRKLVVCDLQGVLNTDRSPRPVFELTDPAIHYKSSRRLERTYGRTDKGQEGIHMFLKTHKCTNLCRLINRRQVKIGDCVIKYGPSSR